jgi:SAM-dependent methyltransferase
MNITSFDDLTSVYEAMIDWPRRLGNEGPFFRSLFEQSDVKRIADVACGTGRHAALFHSWGLIVHASDISPNMIRRARELFGEPPGLQWAVSRFEAAPLPPQSFDAAICIGNSLALASDTTSAGAAIRGLFDIVRPGGLVIVHLLNLWKLLPGPCIWQKIVTSPAVPGVSLILKGIHRCGETGYVDLVVVTSGPGDPPMRSQSVPFLGLKVDQLHAAALRHGAADVAFFGNHQHQPYDSAHSTDLIMVARKS